MASRSSVSWLIGSIRFTADASVNIDGNTQDISTGYYYLRHPTSNLSLISAFATAMANTGLSGVNVYLNRAGYVVLEAASSFEVTWINTTLQTALGFTEDLSGASSYTAPCRSNIAFFPQAPSTPTSILGVVGYDVSDAITRRSPTGLTQSVEKHHTQVFQELRWALINVERLWDTTESPGTFKRFLDDVIRNNRSFFEHQQIDEDLTSSEEVTWTTGLGPYRVRDIQALNDWYRRTINNKDLYSPLRLDLVQVSEYDN